VTSTEVMVSTGGGVICSAAAAQAAMAPSRNSGRVLNSTPYISAGSVKEFTNSR
jgi:hypothetical protein